MTAKGGAPRAAVPDAKTLGRLLLLQTVSATLPDERAIFGFVCRGLADLPGVAAARRLDDGAPAATGETVLPLASRGETFGILALRLDDPAAFEPFLEHVRNTALLLAVVLGERRLRERSERQGLLLESTIAERTRDLAQAAALRETAEEARARANAWLAAVLDSMPEGVLVADAASGRVVMTNSALRGRLGAREEELAGRPFDEFHEGLDLEDLLAKLSAPGVVEARQDLVLVGPGGERSDVDAGFSRMEAGRSACLVANYRDASTRREGETRLRRAQKLEAIGTLAGGIAHDFNNILAAMMGYAELSRIEAPPDPSLRGHLDQILQAGARAKALIDQILTFSRQSTSDVRPMQPQVIVREVLRLLRAALPANIRIRQRIAPDCGWVRADASQLHQILMNLCTNAFHAMEEKGGVLEVTLGMEIVGTQAKQNGSPAEPGRWLRLEVSDSGSGFDMRHAERIFDPYFTTKPQGKGSGLGLAVVAGIVRAHGGRISAESEPGRGSVFRVRLPICDAPARVRPDPETEEAPDGVGRVLFVDDEEALVFLGCSTLASLGYEAVGAGSGEEALERLRREGEAFDAVLTDESMPGMPGSELARLAKLERPGLPVLLCTGRGVDLDEGRLAELGVDRLLRKPVSRSQFALALRDALALRKAVRPAQAGPDPARPGR